MSPRRLSGPCSVKSCGNLGEYRGRCATHRQTDEQRDYGKAHRAERTAWQRVIDSGQVVVCRRCKRRIEPGEPWDLGHPAPKHPEHRGHNRATAGRDRS